MIEYADKDRDGRISFQEFLEVVTKEYPQIWSSKLPSMLQFHKTKEKAEPWMGIIIKCLFLSSKMWDDRGLF
jgi:hypothetical protein